jgi:hypothetical protein
MFIHSTKHALREPRHGTRRVSRKSKITFLSNRKAHKDFRFDIDTWPATQTLLLASIHRGGDVERRIDQNFRDWNIFGSTFGDCLTRGRAESHFQQSL